MGLVSIDTMVIHVATTTAEIPCPAMTSTNFPPSIGDSSWDNRGSKSGWSIAFSKTSRLANASRAAYRYAALDAF